MGYDSDAAPSDDGRRRFLKQASAVALGGLLLGGRALASATHAICCFVKGRNTFYDVFGS
jgi:hypothetical protein